MNLNLLYEIARQHVRLNVDDFSILRARELSGRTNIIVKIDYSIESRGQLRGNIFNFIIVINPNYNKDHLDIAQTISHELVHAVQFVRYRRIGGNWNDVYRSNMARGYENNRLEIEAEQVATKLLSLDF